MSTIIALGLLLISSIFAAVPDDDALRTRQVVIEALCEKVGDHTEPLNVLEIEHDLARSTPLPIHEFEYAGRTLRLPMLGRLLGDPYGSYIHAEMKFATLNWSSCTDDTIFEFSIIAIRDGDFKPHQSFTARDPYSFLNLGGTLDPLLPAGARGHSTSSYTIPSVHVIFDQHKQKQYDELVASITLDTLEKARLNATEEEFITYAVAYYAAANLKRVAEEQEIRVTSHSTSGGQTCYSPVLQRVDTHGVGTFLSYYGLYTHDRSPAVARISLSHTKDPRNEVLQQMLMGSTYTAEAFIQQLGFDKPLEPEASSP